mmetsp:Transcript_62390/g.193373  ORF Transcript_62390/g.193373 Transcript_62390/m.193373 type:complete len:345 (-) Transcript_62390:223-1257(-)
MESELAIAYIILFFAIVAVVVCYLIHRHVGHSVSLRQSEVDVPPPPVPTSWPWELTWLACLTSATAALLIVQIVLGVVVGALLLLADSAHGAADCATYGLAAFVEYMKYTFGRQAVSAETSSRIDRASALFSIVVVLGTSIAVLVEAGLQLRRLRGGEDAETLGDAMLVVAALGMCLNLALLWLHSRLSGGAPEPGKARVRSSCHRGQGRRAAGWRATLHSAFHPGCSRRCQSAPGCAPEEVSNLNVYGVLLHVCTDVLRTLTMLVVGVLVRCGVLKNPVRVDACVAVFICACVLLGSLWLLRVVVSSHGSAAATCAPCAAADPPPVPAYGAVDEGAMPQGTKG